MSDGVIMYRIALTVLMLSLGGCSDKGSGPSTPTRPSTMHLTLDIKLTAEPAKLAMVHRGSFKVGFEAINRGTAPIDPQLDAAVLTANGEHVHAWDLAIQNGPRDASWSQLPPGTSISMAWPLGEAMFERPGTYELVLALGAQRAMAHVEITP